MGNIPILNPQKVSSILIKLGFQTSLLVEPYSTPNVQ